MIEFYQTVMGRTFYEATMPKVARSFERIAEATERMLGLMEAASVPPPIVCLDADLHVTMCPEIEAVLPAGLRPALDMASAILGDLGTAWKLANEAAPGKEHHNEP
jgi:hypothetical protein